MIVVFLHFFYFKYILGNVERIFLWNLNLKSMAGLFTLPGRGCHEDCAYGGMSVCEADILKRIPLFRYMKDPVVHIGELDAQYPYGGQSGWFAFVVEAGQFAYWDMMTTQWRYMNYPPVSSELFLVGLGIDADTLEEGAVLRWNADDRKLECVPWYGATVDRTPGKLDLRYRIARRMVNGNLTFAKSNIRTPFVTPAEGHEFTLYVKSVNGGEIRFPASAEDYYDGKEWVLMRGNSVVVGGGKWAEVKVLYTGNEYIASVNVQP